MACDKCFKRRATRTRKHTKEKTTYKWLGTYVTSRTRTRHLCSICAFRLDVLNGTLALGAILFFGSILWMLFAPYIMNSPIVTEILLRFTADPVEVINKYAGMDFLEGSLGNFFVFGLILGGISVWLIDKF